eukprot:2338298-Rhodomonas_salina.2
MAHFPCAHRAKPNARNCNFSKMCARAVWSCTVFHSTPLDLLPIFLLHRLSPLPLPPPSFLHLPLPAPPAPPCPCPNPPPSSHPPTPHSSALGRTPLFCGQHRRPDFINVFMRNKVQHSTPTSTRTPEPD